METIGVIRRKVTQKEKYVGLSASTAGQIQPKIDTEIRKFVDKITRLVAQDKAVLFDSASPAKDYFTDARSVYTSEY